MPASMSRRLGSNFILPFFALLRLFPLGEWEDKKSGGERLQSVPCCLLGKRSLSHLKGSCSMFTVQHWMLHGMCLIQRVSDSVEKDPKMWSRVPRTDHHIWGLNENLAFQQWIRTGVTSYVTLPSFSNKNSGLRVNSFLSLLRFRGYFFWYLHLLYRKVKNSTKIKVLSNYLCSLLMYPPLLFTCGANFLANGFVSKPKDSAGPRWLSRVT